MAGKNLSKDVLSAINKKTGKHITENAIQKIANGVTTDTMKNDAELRKLIRRVADMASVPVSESTMNDIVKAIKASGMNPSNMEALINMMMKK